MNFSLASIRAEHRSPIIDIFSYPIKSSLAAYPEQRVPYEHFDQLMDIGEGKVGDSKTSEGKGAGPLMWCRCQKDSNLFIERRTQGDTHLRDEQ
ncbi:MAG: hypothetical protein NTY64_14560 [Deltaproteobacteria bacterium]|nr:hypothetical protein [Deltaproteobacteria bacterium]